MQYVSLSGDPADDLERALELDPDFLLAHATLGMLYVLSTGVLPSQEVCLRQTVSPTRALVPEAAALLERGAAEPFCRPYS
jgi:hypothetical protein